MREFFDVIRCKHDVRCAARWHAGLGYGLESTDLVRPKAVLCTANHLPMVLGAERRWFDTNLHRARLDSQHWVLLEPVQQRGVAADRKTNIARSNAVTAFYSDCKVPLLRYGARAWRSNGRG